MANAMAEQYQYQVLNIFQCLIRRRQMSWLRKAGGEQGWDGGRAGHAVVGNMLQESRRRLLHGLTVI